MKILAADFVQENMGGKQRIVCGIVSESAVYWIRLRNGIMIE